MSPHHDDRRGHVFLLALLAAGLVLMGCGAPAVAGPSLAAVADGPPPGHVTRYIDRVLGAGREPIATSAPNLTYQAPIDPPEVSRPFDAPEQPWLPGHRGADLAASPGEEVHAAADGVVAFAGTVAGKPVVSIDHTDGIRTTYEPVEAAVTRGQEVRAGELIGHLEAGHGRDDLHWGARRDANPRPVYLDPMSLLGSAVVIRLYPIR